MKIEVKLHNKWLRALLPALMVLALGACSTSEESSSDTSGGGESFNECTAKCESSDLDCREDCT
jgi:hypothetical protein